MEVSQEEVKEETEILKTKFTHPQPDVDVNHPFRVWLETGVLGSGAPTQVTLITDPSEIIRRYHAETGSHDYELGN